MNAVTQPAEFDVIIAGGGMVGAMLAAALSQPAGRDPALPGAALRVALLEAAMPEPWALGAAPPALHDLRVSALSAASRAMLERVGAWAGIVGRRACPYRRMRVWEGSGDGDITFDARELALAELGHIVENRVIQLALLDVIQALPEVSLFADTRLERFEIGEDRVDVYLQSDGKSAGAVRLRAALLVGADGARSAVREGGGIGWQRHAYEQHALVATVETCLAQQDITWQRYIPGGPQAFLPLSGHQASLVWYQRPDRIAALAAQSATLLKDDIEAAFPPELGGIVRVHEHGSFPLAMAHAERYVGHRLALIGDAAHTVHPHAGQGVNIGLLDAAALAGIVRQSVAAGHDSAAPRALARYARWRREENRVALAGLDAIYQVFAADDPLRRIARRSAFSVASALAPVRARLIQEAAGLGPAVPPLARQQCVKVLQTAD